MKQTAITYFSRTGYTKRVAELLAARLDARVIAIEESSSRRGVRGYLRSAIESLRGVQPVIKDDGFYPEAHQLILIGTPVWAGRTSSPIRAFVRKHDWSGSELAFYCTMGGSGGARVFSELEQLTGRKPIATLALTDADLDAGRVEQKISTFCAALGKHELPSPLPLREVDPQVTV